MISINFECSVKKYLNITEFQKCNTAFPSSRSEICHQKRENNSSCHFEKIQGKIKAQTRRDDILR